MLNLYNIIDSGVALVGNWSRLNGISYSDNGRDAPENESLDRTLIVTTVLAPPYMELVPNVDPEIAKELRAVQPSGKRQKTPNSYFMVCKLFGLVNGNVSGFVSLRI